MPNRRARTFRPQADLLERRQLLTLAPMTATTITPPPDAALRTIPLPAIKAYYGLNDLTFPTGGGSQVGATGQGQTIAILSVGIPDMSYVDSPTATSTPAQVAQWNTSSLALFSHAMGLPDDLPGSAQPSFQFQMVDENNKAWTAQSLSQEGLKASSYPTSGEFDMDTQAAHAIAPQAKIVVVMVPHLSPNDLKLAIQTALIYQPAAISISYGVSEAYQEAAPFPDAAGTTYVQSAGDNGGSYQVQKDGTKLYHGLNWFDPLTVIVGGTDLKQTGTGFTDTAYGKGDKSLLNVGSGGGYSTTLTRPAYQLDSPYIPADSALPKQAAGMRLGPDVSMMASPGMAMLVYSSATQMYSWEFAAGTSLSSPMFGGVMALVDQGRTLAKEPALSSADTLHFLYQAPPSDFNDIVSGSTGYKAKPGFDLASGRGAVQAGLIQYLVGAMYPTSLQLATSTSSAAVAAPITLTALATATGSDTPPTGTVTFLEDGRSIGSVTVGANDAGQATFRFTPKRSGTHTFTASFTPDSTSMAGPAHTVPLMMQVATRHTTPAPAPATRTTPAGATPHPTHSHHHGTKGRAARHTATQPAIATPSTGAATSTARPARAHHHHHHRAR